MLLQIGRRTGSYISRNLHAVAVALLWWLERLEN
jgi:hypothetical protein